MKKGRKEKRGKGRSEARKGEGREGRQEGRNEGGKEGTRMPNKMFQAQNVAKSLGNDGKEGRNKNSRQTERFQFQLLYFE